MLLGGFPGASFAPYVQPARARVRGKDGSRDGDTHGVCLSGAMMASMAMPTPSSAVGLAGSTRLAG
jgi:hypothetical protein